MAQESALTAQMAELAVQIVAVQAEPVKMLPLAKELGELQAKLAALATTKMEQVQEVTTKFTKLRARVAKARIASAMPRHDATIQKPRRLPPKPLHAPAAGLQAARAAALKRKAAQMTGSDLSEEAGEAGRQCARALWAAEPVAEPVPTTASATEEEE